MKSISHEREVVKTLYLFFSFVSGGGRFSVCFSIFFKWRQRGHLYPNEGRRPLGRCGGSAIQNKKEILYTSGSCTVDPLWGTHAHAHTHTAGQPDSLIAVVYSVYDVYGFDIHQRTVSGGVKDLIKALVDDKQSRCTANIFFV